MAGTIREGRSLLGNLAVEILGGASHYSIFFLAEVTCSLSKGLAGFAFKMASAIDVSVGTCRM
jgi:hypothetical protein